MGATASAVLRFIPASPVITARVHPASSRRGHQQCYHEWQVRYKNTGNCTLPNKQVGHMLVYAEAAGMQSMILIGYASPKIQLR